MDTSNTILVPVDFRVASLNTLRLALESDETSRVNAVLCYCEYLNDSISEMLFYSPGKRVNELMSEDFKEALSILKNRFEKKLASVTIELFHGCTQSAFNHFVSGRKVNVIYVPKSYKLHLRRGAFDLRCYIRKSPVPVHEVDWMGEQRFVETGQLESLFINFSEWEKQPRFRLRHQAE